MLTGGESAAQVRYILADLLEDPGIASLPDETPLFREGLTLSSLTGTALLVRLKAELGVDVAAEDLAFASLETIGTLCRYVAARRR